MAMSAIDRGCKPWNLELESKMIQRKESHDESSDEEEASHASH